MPTLPQTRNMKPRWRFSALAVALLTAACARQAVADCPDALPYMTCVNNVNYKLPNFNNILVSAKNPPLIPVPPLTVQDFPGKKNLLEILPLNGAMDLLYNSGYNWRSCQFPVLRGQTVMGYANDNSSDYYATFQPCKLAPWLDTTQHSYVVGAWGDLSKISSKELKKVPAVAEFKKKYGKIGPNMGFCVAANPCGMNIFMGLTNVKRFTSFSVDFGSSSSIAIQVRPDSYFYSYGVSMSPPDWREFGTPMVWGMDPRVVGSLGWTNKVEVLSGTTTTGSVFIQGPLRKGAKVNLLTLSSATLEFGQQNSFWGLVREQTHPASSYGMQWPPNVLLWSKIDLPFRNVAGRVPIKWLDLTSRPTDSHFWMSSYDLKVPAWRLVTLVKPLGNIIKQFYKDATKESTKTITSFEMHGAGPDGAAIRLWFKPGEYQLTAAASYIMGIDTIWMEFGLVFKASKDAKSFDDGVTVSLNGRPSVVNFCKTHTDCAATGCFSYCHDTLHVCVPKKPAPSNCTGTVPVAASAATASGASFSIASEDGVPATIEMMPAAEMVPTSPPLSPTVLAEIGRECEWEVAPCPDALHCRLNEMTAKWTCEA